jgi:hypothetical protein
MATTMALTAWQRFQAHCKGSLHGSLLGARQQTGSTTKALPCNFWDAHGKETACGVACKGFAVQIVARQSVVFP